MSHRTGPRGQTTRAREILRELGHEESPDEPEILQQAIANAKDGNLSLRAAVSLASQQVPQDQRLVSVRHRSKGVRERHG